MLRACVIPWVFSRICFNMFECIKFLLRIVVDNGSDFYPLQALYCPSDLKVNFTLR